MKIQIQFLKAAFITASVLILLISLFSYLRITGLADSSEWVNHTNLVRYHLQNIIALLTGSENSQRGFLLTRDTSLLHARQEASASIDHEFVFLDSLVKDNPVQAKNAKVFRQLTVRWLRDQSILL